jgi:hypothetical protein
MSDGERATTPSQVPTVSRCRHWIGESSLARRGTVWDEASSASTADRSEGGKGVETTQAGHGVTCEVDRMDVSWSARWMVYDQT